MLRDWLGNALVPGVNVDRIDVAAGIDAGTELGFDSATDEMIVQYCLLRWKRGEEEGAEKTWLYYFPNNYTAWRQILAAAIASYERIVP